MKVLQAIRSAWARLKFHMPWQNHAEKCVNYDNLSREMLRNALDDFKWKYYFDKENNCFVGDIESGNIGKVTLAIWPKRTYIHAQAYVNNQRLSARNLTEAMLFCNKWNSKSYFPKAYISSADNVIVGETFMTFDWNASAEFFRECLITNLFKANITFFEEAAADNIYRQSGKRAAENSMATE